LADRRPSLLDDAIASEIDAPPGLGGSLGGAVSSYGMMRGGLRGCRAGRKSCGQALGEAWPRANRSGTGRGWGLPNRVSGATRAAPLFEGPQSIASRVIVCADPSSRIL
jgi:hypothetical protein